MKCAKCGVEIAPTEDGYTHIPTTYIADCDNPSPAKAPPTEPVKVQLVVYADGQIGLAVVDNPARAHEYARAVEGVVVELPVLADYRATKEPSRRR